MSGDILPKLKAFCSRNERFSTRRERLKGNTDEDEVAEQPAEKIQLEDVENNANEHGGQQVTECFRRFVVE